MSSVTQLVSQILQLEARIARLNAQILTAQRSGNNILADQIAGGELADAEIQLASLRDQLIQAQQLAALGTASSGNLARDDQQATVPRSRTQASQPGPQVLTPDGRIQPQPDTTTATTALSPVTENSVDSGTDAPVRPITQTQATPAYGPGLLRDPGDADAQDGGYYGGGIAPAATQAGFGAGTDDSGATKNSTRQEVDSLFNEPFIVAQDNILDQYASYTYSASVYLMTPQAYNNMNLTKRKATVGCRLLFQSGGVGVNQRFGTGNTNDNIFATDYYIDKVELKSKIIGKATGLTHNVTDISMTVIEPNGITFLENLDRAVQEVWGKEEKKIAFTSMIYLLVIRFYGYDDQGNLVQGGSNNRLADGSSDPNAFVEKFYPFLLTKVGFKIANKLVEYELQCKAVPSDINVSSKRGSIPFNIELSGGTLQEILAGPAQFGVTNVIAAETGDILNTTVATTLPAPPKAGSAPSPKITIRKGLVDALNQYQQQLVEQKKQDYADEYVIEFETPAIANATLKKSGTVDKKATANNARGTPADQKLGSKQAMDPNSRNVSAVAGLQVIQFIDQICRNSSYLEDQQLLKRDTVTGAYLPNGTPATNMAWFKINLECEAMTDKIDTVRKDFAYRIKYKISPYKLSNLYSPYFPQPKYNGVQKKYNYWFTGQNTQVLQYEENLNALYYVVMSGLDLSDISANTNDLLKFSAQTASAESDQGATSGTNEPVANAMDQLFSPTDLKECNMTIIGDPAWLQQGEGFAGFLKDNPYRFRAFLADGTINFDSQQILFEVAFNKPTDYNLDTGLANPNQVDSYGTATGAANSQISRVYIATECTSNFKEGRFTQNLKGKLMLFPTKAPVTNRPPQKASAVISVPFAPDTQNTLGTEFVGYSDALDAITGINTDGANYQGRSFQGNFNLLPQSFTAARAAVKTAPPPAPPTSSGLPVGTTPANPAGATAGQVNNPQIIAGSDDAGILGP
jgi:hypothetical protein